MKTEHAIDWRKTAAEVEADYSALCMDRDEKAERIRALEAQLEESKQAAEFNFEQYQDAARLLCEESAKVEALEAHNAALVAAINDYLVANDPSEFGCACDPSVGHLCGPCFAYKKQTPLREALASTPEQSLSSIRRAERERIAGMFEESGIGGEHLAEEIRKLED